jgi:arylsulfatase A-like enzyme
MTSLGDDIILVTIDCWRSDAIQKMPKLSSTSETWNSGFMITAAPHTGGAFPAIFSSTYAPKLYTEDGHIDPDHESIIEILSENGYDTGGFIGSNPILWRWSDYFDQWWNDGLNTNDTENGSQSKFSKVSHLISQHPRVETSSVLRRAEEWWDNNSSPRFLWVHLMDPHAPYRAGFNHARKAGLLRSYSHDLYNHFADDPQNYEGKLPEWVKKQKKSLYNECVKRLDDTLTNWIEPYENEATIIITGDHGEEFEHGLFAHARLYDETVKVPFLSNDPSLIDDCETIRQLDISPRVVDSLGLDIPDEWEGSPSGEFDPQPLLGSLSKYNHYWAGIRSKKYKLIKSFGPEDGTPETEAYNVQEDPHEKNPVSLEKIPNELHQKLNEFTNRKEIKEYIGQSGSFVGKIDEEAAERLKQLGYK